MSTRNRRRNFPKTIPVKVTTEQYEELHGISIILSAQAGKRISINSLLRVVIDAVIRIEKKRIEENGIDE